MKKETTENITLMLTYGKWVERHTVHGEVGKTELVCFFQWLQCYVGTWNNKMKWQQSN